jgi:hypothetical protein
MLYLNCRTGQLEDFNRKKRFFHSLTSWHYSGFGVKLSPIFGLAKSSQIQDQLLIKPNAQIRCSGCYAFGFLFIQIFGFASVPFLSREHF